MDKNVLSHHGVKGMKWGIRRSKSKLGRGKGSANKQSEVENKPIEERKKEILKSRSAKKLYDNADLFTTQELQSAYNRLSLERNIASLSPKEVSKGKQFIDKVVSSGRTVNDIADVGMKTYNNFAKTYNTFSKNGKTNPLPIIKGG